MYFQWCFVGSQNFIFSGVLLGVGNLFSEVFDLLVRSRGRMLTSHGRIKSN